MAFSHKFGSGWSYYVLCATTIAIKLLLSSNLVYTTHLVFYTKIALRFLFVSFRVSVKKISLSIHLLTTPTVFEQMVQSFGKSNNNDYIVV